MTAGRDGRNWRRLVAIARREFVPVCHLCRLPIDMDLDHRHPMSWTLDHLISLDQGGEPEELSNLAPAHRSCNSRKGVGRPVAPPKTSRKWK